MNQLFMIPRSLNCDQKVSPWREILSKRLGSLSLLLMLTMLIPAISFAQDVIYTAPAPYAPAGSPCSAHRWFAGDGWRLNDNTNTVANTWEAVVVSSPRLQPKGIVRCASSAEAESQLQNYKAPYNPSDFAIPSTLTDIFDMSAGAGTFTGATINGPTPGEDIVWLNFDIRPFAGTYQFQVVTNERVGWALYHVPVNLAQPQNDPSLTYATCNSYPTVACNGRDVSGDISCPNPTLVPANIIEYQVGAGGCGVTLVTRGYGGLSGNGWSLITVPSFEEPTNYYLAMWMEPTNVTTFPGSMNLVYKSRYGCGGSTCFLDSLGTNVSCDPAGTGNKKVCATIGGTYGRWFFDDVNNNGSNFTIQYFDNQDNPLGNSSSISDGGTVTLSGGSGAAVKATVCGIYPPDANYSMTFVPDCNYSPSGGQTYIPCGDTVRIRGDEELPPCTLKAVAQAPNIQILSGITCDYAFQPSVANGKVITLSTTGTAAGSTITWGAADADPSMVGKFNYTPGVSATNTLTIIADGSGNIKIPVSSKDPNGCICRDTVCINITSICPQFQLSGPSYLCKFSPGTYAHSAVVDLIEYTYNWSITPVSAGTIVPSANFQQAVVSPNGTSNTFYVRMSLIANIFGQECNKDSILVTINYPVVGTLASGQVKCLGQAFDQICATGSNVDSFKFERAATCAGPFTQVRAFAVSNCFNPGTTAGAYRVIGKRTQGTAVCFDTSNCIILSYINPDAGDIGQSQTICKGSCASNLTGGAPTSVGTGCSVSYVWQSSTSCSGAPWNQVGTDQNLSNVCPTVTRVYRRITSVTCGIVTCSDTSNCVTITVIDPEAGDIGVSQTICKGSCASNLTGNAPTATSGCNVDYIWQSSTSCSGAPWTQEGTGKDLSNVCPTSTRVYRRITSVTCNDRTCKDTSNCVTITVLDPEAGDINPSQTICKGSCASTVSGGTPTVPGGCTPSYIWQSAPVCGGPWSTITGITTPSASGLCPLTTTSYRRIASVTCNGKVCSDTSNCITITVIDPEAGNITGTQIVCRGECPSQLTGGAPTATAPCNVSYLWQSSATCSGPWVAVGTGQNYTPPCPFNATTSYRRITSVTCNDKTCTDTSNCVTVTINDVDGGSIDGDTTICNGSLPGTLTGTAGSASGIKSYEWLKSESGCNGPWTAIPLSNSPNFTPGALANNTCYVRITISTVGNKVCKDTSNCICVTVNLCSDNCSYTQGYFGSPGKSCDGVTRYNSALDLITELLGVNSTPRPIIMGDIALNSITIPGTAAAALRVNQVLPGGKTPNKLPNIGACNILTPACFDANILTLRGKINNVLLSQALVLTLNSRMNDDRLASFPIQKGWLTTQKLSGCGQLSSAVPCSSDEGSIQSWQINESVWAFLTKGGTVPATVADLINLANKVLGGTWVPGTLVSGITFPVPSFSAVSGACGAFNEGFDECRSFLGYFSCPQNCDNFNITPCPSATTPTFDRNDVPVSGTNKAPKVEVFPNPFFDQATFVIESPVDAKASLKVYNSMGQLVSVLYQGMIPAGKSKNILFKSPVADGSLFYIYEQNGKKITGKLIKQ